MSVFRDLVKKVLAANRAKHPGIRSWHEAYGLIAEEVHELQEEIFTRSRRDDPLRCLNELVEIAAMCERAAQDLIGPVEGKGDGSAPT